MKKIMLMLMFLAIIVFSCKNNKDIELIPMEKDPKAVWLKDIKDLDEIYMKIETIDLDPRKEAILTTPYNIRLCGNNCIVVSDLGVIKKFELSGNYIGDIGRKGRGPGEYLTPFLMDASENYILVYDNQLSRINLYNSLDGKIKHQIYLKYPCEGAALYKNSIIVFRSEIKNKRLNKYFIDFYNYEGNVIAEEELMPPGNPKELYYLGGGYGKYKIIGDLLYLIQRDDMKVKCYDLASKKSIWKADYVPSNLKLEPIKSDPIGSDVEDWSLTRSRLYGMDVIAEKIIQVRTEIGTILYDTYGNYLTTIPFRKGSSRFSIVTTNGNYLFNCNVPYENKIMTDPKNLFIEKYEFKNK
ncbi:MAG: hypothetical protein C0412_11705 [Flavobacterium sp.]|nr:hypothetical protein [Flavobacterium sp.]